MDWKGLRSIAMDGILKAIFMVKSGLGSRCSWADRNSEGLGL